MSKVSPIRPDEVPNEEKVAAQAIVKWDLRYNERIFRLHAVIHSNCFRKEVDWLLNLLKVVDSPVVFSHNDINTGNILVRRRT